MILQPKLEDLIRHSKARELKFDKNNITIEEGFERYDDSILVCPNSSIIGLYHKENLAGLLGFEERYSTIHINQIQGRKGKKAYKPLSSIDWERVLIRSLLEFGYKREFNNFTSTSSALEHQDSSNIFDCQRLLKRYDASLRAEGFKFNSFTLQFEYII